MDNSPGCHMPDIQSFEEFIQQQRDLPWRVDCVRKSRDIRHRGTLIPKEFRKGYLAESLRRILHDTTGVREQVMDLQVHDFYRQLQSQIVLEGHSDSSIENQLSNLELSPELLAAVVVSDKYHPGFLYHPPCNSEQIHEQSNILSYSIPDNDEDLIAGLRNRIARLPREAHDHFSMAKINERGEVGQPITSANLGVQTLPFYGGSRILVAHQHGHQAIHLLPFMEMAIKERLPCELHWGKYESTLAARNVP